MLNGPIKVGLDRTLHLGVRVAFGAFLRGVIGGMVAERIRPSVLRGIVVVFAVTIAIVYFVQ